MNDQTTSPKSNPTRRRIIAGGIAVATAGIGATVFAQMSTAGGKVVISPKDAYDRAKSGNIILVDIRTPGEWQQTGVPEGAIALNMQSPEFVQTLAKLRENNPDTPIALSCRTGSRSNYAVTALTQQGFPLLVDAHEGIAGGPAGPGWLAAGLPVYPGTPEEIKKRINAALAK